MRQMLKEVKGALYSYLQRVKYRVCKTHNTEHSFGGGG